jgi:2-pyrone-4,6-dicarboxylate lactonase
MFLPPLEHQDLLHRIGVPFVIDHMGRVRAAQGIEQKPFQLLLRLMRENPLAWVKICGAERVSAGKRPFGYAVRFAQQLFADAPEGRRWGTDWAPPNN